MAKFNAKTLKRVVQAVKSGRNSRPARAARGVAGSVARAAVAAVRAATSGPRAARPRPKKQAKAAGIDLHSAALIAPFSVPVAKYPDGHPIKTVAHSLTKRIIVKSDPDGNFCAVVRPWNWINYSSTPANGNDSGYVYAQACLEAGAVGATSTKWTSATTANNVPVVNFDNFASLGQVAEKVRYVSGGVSFVPITSDSTDSGIFYMTQAPMGANAEDSTGADASWPLKVGNYAGNSSDTIWDITTVLNREDTKIIPVREGFHSSLIPMTQESSQGFLDSDGGTTYGPDDNEDDVVSGYPNLLIYAQGLPASTNFGMLHIKAMIEYTVSDYGTGVVVPTVNAARPAAMTKLPVVQAVVRDTHPLPGPAPVSSNSAFMRNFAGNLIGGLDTAARIAGSAGRLVSAGRSLRRSFQ
jgi:hypothetical protein